MKKSLFFKFLILSFLIAIGGISESRGEWLIEDIGATGHAGEASNSGINVYTISGAGSGVSGAADALSFVYQEVDGDCELVARIESIGSQSPYSAAGLMIRESLAAGAKTAFVSVSSQDGVNFFARTSTGYPVLKTVGPNADAPRWIKLLKVGNSVLGYISSDGVNWELVGRTTLNLGWRCYVGFGVSSGIQGTLTTGVFSHTGLATNLPYGIPSLRLWLRADLGVTMNGTGGVSFWKDQSGLNNDASLVGSSAPVWTDDLINGRPSVRFNGSDQRLSIPDSLSLKPTQLTGVVVARRMGGSGRGILFAKSSATYDNGYSIVYSSTDGIQAWVGAGNSSYVNPTGTLAVGTPALLMSRYDQQNLNLFINGTLTSSSSFSAGITHPSVAMEIGGRGGSWLLNADIAEILLFGQAVTDVQRKEIEAYAFSKYGVGVPPVLDATPALSAGVNQPGIYSGPQTISIDIPAGTVVRYTLDGSDPTEESPVYTGPLFISSTTQLKFRAFRTGYAPSTVLSTSYAIEDLADIPRAGLSLWLRADQGVAVSGEQVAQWADLSGHNNHAAQETVAKRPLSIGSAVNGKPVIRFDGTNDSLLIPNTPDLKSSQVTVFVVGRHNNTAGNWLTWVRAGDGISMGYALVRYTQASNEVRFLFNSYNGTTHSEGQLPNGNYGIVSGRYDGASIDVHVNGQLAKSVAATAAITYNSSPIFVGSGGTNYYLNGDIAELLIYNRAVSEVERRLVQAYLHERYNLGSQPEPEPPVLTPPVVFSDSQAITMTLPADGGTIRYTTDGSDPSESSAIYDSQNPPVLTGTAVVKARVFKTGYAPSAIAMATYTKDLSSVFSRDGLSLWLRADTGVSLNGTAVGGWEDESGKGNHALQVTAGKRPVFVEGELNGRPVLRFDGADDSLSVPETGDLKPSNMTVFVVGRHTDGGTAYRTYVRAGSALSQGYALMKRNAASTAGFNINTHTSTYAAGTLPANTYGIMAGRYDGSKLDFFINGVLGGTYATSAAVGYGTSPVYIGSTGTANYLQGDIAEVMVFNRALSDIERKEVETYLHARYAVGSASQVDPPVLPSTAIFSGSFPLVITSPMSGAVLRYTLDGSDPDENSPIFDPANSPVLTGTTVVKVRAFKDGYTASDIVTMTYTKDASSAFTRDGLSLWLRADAGVVIDGAAASGWMDQSGKANDASQTTVSKQPVLLDAAVNGQPTLKFDGTNDSLDIQENSDLKPERVTVFVVGRHTDGGTAYRTYVRAGGALSKGYALMKRNAASTAGFNINTYTSTYAAGTLPVNTYGVMTGRYNGENIDFFVNGLPTASYASTATISYAASPVYIGSTATGNYLQGEIAEVLIFNRALSDAERKGVESYLYARYGIGTAPQMFPPILSGSTIFAGSQTVAMESPISGGTIRYTTDGSNPEETSPVFDPNTPLVLTATTTVKAVVYKDGYSASEVVTMKYVRDDSAAFVRTGLSLWLRADEGVTTGTGVSGWADQSGRGNDASQDTATKQPLPVAGALSGKPVVQFDGTNDSLTIPTTPELAPLNMTVFIAGRHTDGGTAYRTYFRGGGNALSEGYAMLKRNSGGTAGFNINSHTATYAAGSLAANTYGLMMGRYDGAKVDFYVNGVATGSLATSATVNYDAGSLTYLGATGTTNYLKGDIAEVLVFNRAISDVERKGVESYLYSRYALGNSPQLFAPVLPVSTVFSGNQTVTMTSPIPGATIRYTTDGSDPTTGSPTYTSALVFTESTTVKARAYKAEYMESQITTAVYTKDASAVFNREGLKLWLRADAGITTTGVNGTVSAWADQSGNGNDALQATAANQPLRVEEVVNGRAVLRFNGSNNFLAVADSPSLNPAKLTLYLVGKPTGGGNSGAVLFKSGTTSYADGYGFVRQGAGNTFGFYVNSNASSKTTGTLSPGDFFRAQAFYDQNWLGMFINGRPQTPIVYNPAINHTVQPLKIGGSGAATYSFQGDIVEILLFDRPLTMAEQAAMEKYLDSRYAIGAGANGEGNPVWWDDSSPDPNPAQAPIINLQLPADAVLLP